MSKNIQSIFGKGGTDQVRQTQFVGSIHAFPPSTDNLGKGWVEMAGVELNREDESALWNWVQNTQQTILTDENWLAAQTTNPDGVVEYYSEGDGTTTFRTPTVGSLGGFFKSQGLSSDYGEVLTGFNDSTAVNGLASSVASTFSGSSTFTGTAKAPTATFKGNALSTHYHQTFYRGTSGTTLTSGGSYPYTTAAMRNTTDRDDYNMAGGSAVANVGRNSGTSAGTPSGTVTVNSYTPAGTVATTGTVSSTATLTGDSLTSPQGQTVRYFIYTGADVVYSSDGTKELEGEVEDLQSQIDSVSGELDTKQDDLSLKAGATVQNPILLSGDGIGLNNYRHPNVNEGWYKIPATETAQNGGGFPPDKVAGTLHCFSDASSLANPNYPDETVGMTQIYYPYNSNIVWRRSLYSAGWSSWENIGAPLTVRKTLTVNDWGGSGQTLTLYLSRTGDTVCAEMRSSGGGAIDLVSGEVLPITVPTGFRAPSINGRIIGKINSGSLNDNIYNLGYGLQNTSGDINFYCGNATPFSTMEASGTWVTDNPFPYDLAFPTVAEQLKESFKSKIPDTKDIIITPEEKDDGVLDKDNNYGN